MVKTPPYPSLSLAARVLALGALLLAAPAAAPAAPSIVFTPCAQNPTVGCGHLDVPLDHAAPSGPRVRLAVARAAATDPAHRIGALFVHPGGHLSGVDFVVGGVGAPSFERIRRRFDIVSLDPRGAGGSQPLDCGFDLPEPSGHTDEALIAFLDDRSRRVADQCLDQNPAFVLSISGNNFARDIDAFREALGEAQLSFGMLSNSGPVGAVYAGLFPARVRAMLLDSPVGPDFRDALVERLQLQSQAYDLALQRLEQVCRRAAGCPLQAAGVVAAYDRLRARLLQAPVLSDEGVPFGAEDLADVFTLLLPREDLWPFTIEAMSNALDGDFGALTELQGIVSGDGDALLARLCNDYGTRRGAADYLSIARAVGTTHPRFFGTLDMLDLPSICGAWPAADVPQIRNLDGLLDTPVLVMGSQFDSDAPFVWTQQMADVLGSEAHVVRYQGGGHGLAPRPDLPCIADIVDGYLFDLQLPPVGATCEARFPSLAKASSARGPVAAGERLLRRR